MLAGRARHIVLQYGRALTSEPGAPAARANRPVARCPIGNVLRDLRSPFCCELGGLIRPAREERLDMTQTQPPTQPVESLLVDDQASDVRRPRDVLPETGARHE